MYNYLTKTRLLEENSNRTNTNKMLHCIKSIDISIYWDIQISWIDVN